MNFLVKALISVTHLGDGNILNTAPVDFYTCYVDHFLFIPGNSKKWKTEADNGGNDGLSTTMLVCLLAGIGGAILFIVMLSLLVKRSRSTGKGE